MRIAVAMSGGVDSSVAALLLRRDGHDVAGITMVLGTAGTSEAADALARAEAAARILGIPHRAVDVSAAFQRSVVDYFVSEYAQGRTPNPCIPCNRILKFGLLLDGARADGASMLATGHYARATPRQPGGPVALRRGLDAAKDQSYFLYSLTQVQLTHVLFPLGDLTKSEVRRIALEAGIPTTRADESADACFVPGGDVAEFLRARAPGAATPGPIVDSSGARIGTHRGYGLYTVGQRSALGLSRATPAYVVRIVPRENTVVVGEDRDLYADVLEAEDLSWVAGAPPARRFRATAKVRYAGRAEACDVALDRGRAAVRFVAPQRAVTPGQAVVFYDGDEVLGGGTIVERCPGP